MSALAASDIWSRIKEAWARLRATGQAAAEHGRLVAAAQRTWLVGATLAGAVAWLNVVPDVTVPWWAVAAIIVATLAWAQFQAFQRVREEREAANRSRVTRALLDEIGLLRSKEAALRSRVIRDWQAYEQWKTELVALRGEIQRKIERGISRAEAETFHTIGNLHTAATGGVSDEHNMLLAVAARDLDHLAELIHGYARFDRD